MDTSAYIPLRHSTITSENPPSKLLSSKFYQISLVLFVGLLATATLDVSNVFRDYSRSTALTKSTDIIHDWASWCLEHVPSDGFIMKDNKEHCWTMSFTMLRNDTYTSCNISEIHIDIQSLLANKTILFLGDSISRFAMHAFRSFIANEDPINWEVSHTTMSYTHGQNTTIDWTQAWPASSILEHLHSAEYAKKPYDHIFLLNGLHEVRDNMSLFENHIDTFTHQIRNLVSEKRAVFQTAPPLNNSGISPERMTPTFNDENVRKYNERMVYQMRNNTEIPVLDGYWTFKVDDQIDGVHSHSHAFATAYRYAWYLNWKNEVETRGFQEKSDNV